MITVSTLVAKASNQYTETIVDRKVQGHVSFLRILQNFTKIKHSRKYRIEIWWALAV